MAENLEQRAEACRNEVYELPKYAHDYEWDAVIRAALRAERAAALEEAEKVLDAKAEWAASLGYEALADALREQAAAIRKLKEQPE